MHFFHPDELHKVLLSETIWIVIRPTSRQVCEKRIAWPRPATRGATVLLSPLDIVKSIVKAPNIFSLLGKTTSYNHFPQHNFSGLRPWRSLTDFGPHGLNAGCESECGSSIRLTACHTLGPSQTSAVTWSGPRPAIHLVKTASLFITSNGWRRAPGQMQTEDRSLIALDKCPPLSLSTSWPEDCQRMTAIIRAGSGKRKCSWWFQHRRQLKSVAAGRNPRNRLPSALAEDAISCCQTNMEYLMECPSTRQVPGQG